MTEIDWRARAEAAEAELDEQIEAAIALRHDLDTLRDLYGAAEARIAAVRDRLASWDTPTTAAHKTTLSNVVREIGALLDRAALVEPVGPSDNDQRNQESVVEPVGEPPRPTAEETAAMDALVEESERLGLYRENYLSWDALRADVERINARVGEPQPPTCATCGGLRWICDYDESDEYRGCIDSKCPRNRRPCPSCAPTESDPT